MTLRLVIEHSLHPQPHTEMRHESGDLTIGRGADCDWQIEDPDMFVSRRHCVVSARDGRYEVTDASRGGLFIDGADTPLGAGNTVALQSDMRLRLGDVVIRAEIAAEEGAKNSAPSRPAASDPSLGGDDFFSRPVERAPERKRPESLPDPFEKAQARPARIEKDERTPPRPIDEDDPFMLDPLPRQTDTPDRQESGARDDFGFSDIFAEPEDTPPPAEDRSARTVPPPAEATATPRKNGPQTAAPGPDRRPPVAPDARAAFLRGLGLEPADHVQGDDLEALGRRFRLLVDGLMHLLRTRAKEKGSARVAQTIIGSADVNPLKFLATTEDALGSLVTPRGKGYLDPDEAITAAFRDLSDHQMRTWIALQEALRRMIDRFDPAEFERLVEDEGLMKSLLSGGRGARLWELYRDRYRDIAKSAEDRFLGEVGADFRDAYEGNRRTTDD
ncbi:hypothetical protein DEA8626_02237 [Defluviimonas aquaemixtae]|uniref:FHA domain-containing protein n=1 Tax=Albidovulum aquaemixtae TaxID=1542388 RepID=A0A2R8B7T0_9RHOB|nr:type VI secretion system-associated FHA domain protein TagH [Defluviimonas aquaemixtae]SPH18695.1 hypothetical protein DEA8626_02237 [Defluviimonas aquaemixtae]